MINMDDDLLICQCANINVKDVKDFMTIYHEAPLYVVKGSLNIGRGCGSCQRKDNHITNIKLKEVYNYFKK